MSHVEATGLYRILTYRSSTAGADGLNTINTRLLNQGAVVMVANALYRLDKESVAVADGVYVVAPINSPGRWNLIAGSGSGIGWVPNLAALALLTATSPYLIWVETLECFWHRNPTSAAAADAITIIAAIGGGRWERITASTSLRWLSQAAWYMDPSGDDENPGTALAPLQSFEELNRRLSVGLLNQHTEVVLVAGASYSGEHEIRIDLGNSPYRLIVRGEPTTVLTGTFSAFSARDHGTQLGTQVSAVGIVNWAAYVGRRIAVTNGVAAGAYTWVAKSNPGGAGADVALTGIFASGDPFTGALTEREPAPGDTFSLQTFPAIESLKLSCSTAAGNLCVRDLRIAVLNLNETMESYEAVVVDGVSFGDQWDWSAIYGAPGEVPHQVYRSQTTWNGGGWTIYVMGTITWTYGVSAGMGISRSKSTGYVWMEKSLFVDTWWALSMNNCGMQIGFVLDDVQFFDNNAALYLDWPSSVAFEGLTSGARNLFGLQLSPFEYHGGLFSVTWNDSANEPNIGATTSEIRVYMDGFTINLQWSTVCFRNDEQHGTAQLGGGTGTVVVTARNANQRKVQVTRNTKGGTLGMLEVPAASRAAGQFTINSVDTAGASVNDTSTVDWMVSGWSNPFVCIGKAGEFSSPR